MMEVLQRGAATRLPALAILQAIFEVRHLPSQPHHCNISQLLYVRNCTECLVANRFMAMALQAGQCMP